VRLTEYPVPGGSHPHDVVPAADGTVWYTAHATGRLGPKTGRTEETPLGDGSAPHGVIVGPDGAPWITVGGLNAIVRVDPATRAVHRFPLPADRPAVNMNTATFDRRGRLWFTGQGGVYGSLDTRGGRLRVFDAPGGAGPYGITTTPDGEIYYASLAGSHLARIDPASGKATVLEPPTPGQGARRVWSDSAGRLWVSEWNAGRLGRYDPAAGRRQEWPLPGQAPQPYAVYVDDRDMVRQPRPGTVGLWSRAAALLGRQALEAELDELWSRTQPRIQRASTKCQLLCLPVFLSDRRLAGRAAHAWVALTRACHQHPYELPPTADELERWLDAVEAVIKR
jgi:streptogramin lyase